MIRGIKDKGQIHTTLETLFNNENGWELHNLQSYSRAEHNDKTSVEQF